MLQATRDSLPAGRRKARPGEANGRAKLRDGDVRLLRMCRVQSDSSYDMIGRAFGLTSRHAKRLCLGQLRIEAGGPIEVHVAAEEITVRFDSNRMIRCKCGAMAHPSTKDPSLCFACAEFPDRYRREERPHRSGGIRRTVELRTA